ncbi:putative late blight resistance protein homolog R1A-3 [Cynara cardunculus var. scolymus]|uniref:putative late blight resistance protein homolog R1A-3 n=1 Tax=Cynara cardunculus var. scolymus TaxID=59895 RepID=UPI000D6261C5|nr:putative late blight resistance protein homolog R1A-3 [Cynara cardunculus var. scolymus]
MANTGLELLMENLKHIIYCDNNPLIKNNLFVQDKRPQILFLYQELASLRTFVIDMEVAKKPKELKKVGNLERRLRNMVEEVEDIVDLFLTSTFIRNNTSMTMCDFDSMIHSLNFDRVMEEIRDVKEEIMDKKMQPRPEGVQPAAGAMISRNLSSAVLKEEILVGLDDASMVLVERLTGNHKNLDVISVVGMGGLGKTTLATKVFNDRFIVYHFHVRAWVLVSQSYGKKDLLISLLTSIGKLTPEEINKLKIDKISELLYKSLKGKRYFIVIDDVWSAKAWDDLKMYFPNDNTGSRILLTTRLSEIAFYAKPSGFAHFLRFLTNEESWELLRRKVFQEDGCPERLIKPGKQIAKKCQGLPLAVVVIAGVLVKGEKSQELWEKVAESVNSYIVGNPKGYLDTLALSYNHLPRHLRDCFLYVGGFPEDCKIPVRRLIWLWVAEGFIREEGERLLEEVAEDYLMDLVDRSLLIVAKRRSNGGVKACRIHDLLRELCLKKAKEENFLQQISRSSYLSSSKFIRFTDKQRRLFADSNFFTEISTDHSAPHIRSFLCFNKEWYFSLGVQRCFHPFLLLRVLDLQTIHTSTVPLALELLVHLRHLALWSEVTKLPSSVCNLWNLQTLILKENYSGFMKLPENISKMINLRHLWIEMIISIPDVHNPTNSHVFFNLQTISMLQLHGRAESLLKRIPNVRKLGCAVYGDQKDYAFPNFVLLDHLETLKVIQPEVQEVESLLSKKLISFPVTLKKLTLSGCRLPWSGMSKIQWLPNLEVLKLLNYAFEGPSWDTGEGQFHQLKFLKLQNLDIQQWDAYSSNFPCLKRLVLLECYYLKGIPDEVGDIPTLEIIDIDKRNHSLVKSADKIREEQHTMGNYELKVNVIGFLTSIR